MVRPQSAAFEHWWAMTCWTIVQSIRDPTQLLKRELGGTEAFIEHPRFQNHIAGDVAIVWPGFPAGTRFEPDDKELLKHLEEKVGQTNTKPHPFIDALIPTIGEPEGVCFTHPEKLPGIRMDGSKHHFFHKIRSANGGRKQRKISNESDYLWHQTGHPQEIKDDCTGVIRGWKKIFVLKKAEKKADWTLHQYHLGVDRKEGDELVLSKVFYDGLLPKLASRPFQNNCILLQDHQEDETVTKGQKKDVADALWACCPSTEATIKGFLALIAVPEADNALPEEEQPLPELPEWHWHPAEISVADGNMDVPYEDDEPLQVQHEAAVPHDHAEPIIQKQCDCMDDVDVLPVPRWSSPDLGHRDELVK